MSQLHSFFQNYPIVAIKTGTETEDMGEEEIRTLCKLIEGKVPVYVKIGGPEARNDMRICERLAVNGIAAPMIESEYGLRNFIQSLKNVVNPIYYVGIRKSINLETITAYRNLMEIMDSPFIQELDSITAARSDLSSSMNLKPDDKEVTKVTAKIVKIAKEAGLKTSVGGTITKKNFSRIVEEIQPHYINSRHVMVEISKIPRNMSGEEVAEAMLLLELEIYDRFKKMFPEKSFLYKNRIETNQERIGRKKVLYFIR